MLTSDLTPFCFNQIKQPLLSFSQMGAICPMDPEVRAINKKNNELRNLIKSELKGLQQYDFYKSVVQALNLLKPEHLYNVIILQDIEKLHAISRSSFAPKTQKNSEQLEDELKNSCLILENEANLDQEQEEGQRGSQSFCKNIKHYESLVQQIDILYKKEIKISEYSQALYFFLKWASIFEQHTCGGSFLRPIYTRFSKDLSHKSIENFDDIVVEVQQFGQFMVSIITKIYSLKDLSVSQGGKLIKNDNIYNLIMGFLFKKTKIKRFLLKCIYHKDGADIEAFGESLKKWEKKTINQFGVSSKFSLFAQCSDITSSEKTKITDSYVQPYAQSLQLVKKLGNRGSPITKLKIIVAISKQILKDIRSYYELRKRQVPQIDPDNLCSIVMYLLAQAGKKEIYEELKIVEHFTTSNCMNCISGYYLNVILAASESLIHQKE